MRPHRGIIFKAIRFVLAGAIINVAVALLCAYYSNGPGVRDDFVTRPLTDAELQATKGLFCLEYREMTTAMRRAVGWPLPSFEGAMNLPEGTPAFPFGTHRWQTTTGILLGDPFGQS